jgi:hypothetical protein
MNGTTFEHHWSNSVLKFARAIAHAEGFGDPDAIPTKANNPGDLTGADGGSLRVIGTMNKEGVLHFENLDDGWLALHIKVDRMLSGKSKVYPLTLTLEQVGIRYSGSDSGDWARNVASYLGVTPQTTLQELSEG